MVPPTQPRKTATVSLMAVGDISFKGRYENKPRNVVFSRVAPIWSKGDLVCINLESPLTSEAARGVNGKCCLRGSPGWARILKESGVHLASLANNHMMDFGPDGLHTTIDALERAGIQYVGAGKNRELACRPVFVEVKGIKVAFLARTSVIVRSRCYAGENTPGVAFFDLKEVEQQVSACKGQADLVVLLIHWGIEKYRYPSPSQKLLARRLLDAGIDLILGAHPHVLQGMETRGKKMVFYSLGNFLFYEHTWSYTSENGVPHIILERLTSETREGGVCEIVASRKGIEAHKFIPTVINSEGVVEKDHSTRRVREFNSLSSRLNIPGYRPFWRIYSIEREWHLRLRRQTVEKLKWSNVKRLRWRHIKDLAGLLRRSSRVVTEKSTNPYE